MKNISQCVAFDIDGVLVSDTVDFSKDIDLNTFISGRLEPIFQVPEDIEYVLLTSREYNQTNSNNVKKLIRMLENKPIDTYMYRNDNEDRYAYKTRIMNMYPQITLFIESERECINYMVEHGIDPKRLLHWDSFIQVCLQRLVKEL